MALNQDSYGGMVSIQQLTKHIEEIVVREVSRKLPELIKEQMTQILDKQRKDIGDELVRILLQKAFEAKLPTVYPPSHNESA
jgi:hypothetical protein